MVMRKHQRYFPVEDASSEELLPHFITAANGDVDEDAVRVGNESVLTARYQDAVLLRGGHQRTLAAFKPELEGIIPDRARDDAGEDREVEKLAPALAKTLGFSDADAKVAAEAASLASGPRHAARHRVHLPRRRHGGALREARGPRRRALQAIFEPRCRTPQATRSPGRTRASRSPSPTASTPSSASSPSSARKGRRTPFGLRRAAYGAVQTLVAADAVRRPRRARRGREGSARGGGGIGHRRVPGVRHAAPGAVPRRRRVRRGGGEAALADGATRRRARRRPRRSTRR